MYSCSKDETTPDAPKVTAPATADVQVGESTDLSFSVTVPGGFSTASVNADGGSVSVTSSPSDGATEGTIVVSFTADESEGAGSVTLSVTDKNQKTDAAD